MRTCNFQLLVIFSLCLIYAVVRYCIFGEVEFDQLPIYILNKSISLLSVIGMTFYCWHIYRSKKDEKRYWGNVFYTFMLLHILISLMIVGPDYYPVFYLPENPKLSIWGGASLLFAALAAVVCVLRYTVFKNIEVFTLMIFIAYAVSSHLMLISAAGWIVPAKWLGGLPPISLISFLISIAALLIAAYAKFRGRAFGT